LIAHRRTAEGLQGCLGSSGLWTLAALFLSLMLAACLPGEGPDEEGDGHELARINDYVLTTKDFRTLLCAQGERTPGAVWDVAARRRQLEAVVDRELLIQEAVRQGLGRDPKFVETMERFWEQTLIKTLLERTSGEIEKGVVVTEEEVQALYAGLGKEVALSLKAFDEEDAALAWSLGEGPAADTERALLSELSPPVRKALGPSPKADGGCIIREDGGWLAYRIVEVLNVDPPPYQEAREGLYERLLGEKREEALDAWLASLRERALIEINEEALRAMP
jgi:hypothetical protein